jgi:hypothetical protein
MLVLLTELILVLGSYAGVLLAAANVVTLPHISPTPANASQTLDRSLASFSIEPAYMLSFGGNDTNPNELTRQLMQRLVERTGTGPDLRPGGTTMWALQIHILLLSAYFTFLQ